MSAGKSRSLKMMIDAAHKNNKQDHVTITVSINHLYSTGENPSFLDWGVFSTNSNEAFGAHQTRSTSRHGDPSNITADLIKTSISCGLITSLPSSSTVK